VSERRAHDYYPTPPCAVLALRQHLGTLGPRPWLDPAAGVGTLLDWFDPPGERHAIELRLEAADELRRRNLTTAVIADALNWPWPFGDVIANPPFYLLDAFVTKILAHVRQCDGQAWVLMPLVWLSASSRNHLPRPCQILPMTWRPSFTGDGQTDPKNFCWAGWTSTPTGSTMAHWLHRPQVPAAMLAEYDRVVRDAPKSQVQADLFT